MSGSETEAQRIARIQNQDRQKKRREINTAFLYEMLPGAFVPANFGACLIFRESNKPKVDYYPGTNKWRSGGKTYTGNVENFISWYKKQAG